MQKTGSKSCLAAALALSSVALVVAATLAAGPAAAAIITRTYDFSVIDFVPVAGSDPAPTNPVQGQFTITFDNAVDISDLASGIVLNSLNIALGSAIQFSYFSSSDTLRIGGAANGGPGGLSIGVDDFELDFIGASTSSPVLNFLTYVSAGNLTSRWSSQQGSVSVVPEPSTALLFALGLVVLAGGRERRAALRSGPLESNHAA